MLPGRSFSGNLWPMEPSVGKGKIVVYRLFDVGSYIDLALVETQAGEKPATRMRLSKHAQVKALEFKNPPVSFQLDEFSKPLFNATPAVAVTARVYDFGVISISFSIPVPPGTTMAELEEVARTLDSDEGVEEKAREFADEVLSSLSEAVTDPGVREGFVEDYTVFFMERLEGAEKAEDLLQAYDPSGLLLYETGELSAGLREETLRHRFSYRPDDLVLLHYDNALVVEPSGNRDVLDIVEFANAQLLVLRCCDDVLDRELDRTYEELSRKGRVSLMRLGEFEGLALKITELVRDLTEVTEKVNNALKLTEDVYYARVYTTAMGIFRSRDWEGSIKEKLKILSDTYGMLHNEISIKRSHLLEGIIILLILIEVVFVMVGWF